MLHRFTRANVTAIGTVHHNIAKHNINFDMIAEIRCYAISYMKDHLNFFQYNDNSNTLAHTGHNGHHPPPGAERGHNQQGKCAHMAPRRRERPGHVRGERPPAGDGQRVQVIWQLSNSDCDGPSRSLAASGRRGRSCTRGILFYQTGASSLGSEWSCSTDGAPSKRAEHIGKNNGYHQ